MPRPSSRRPLIVTAALQYEIQENELSLMRTYESAIVQRETEVLSAALDASNARDARLARLGRLLRAVIRKMNGEDIRAYEAAASPASSRFLSHDRTATASSSSSHAHSEPAQAQPDDAQEPATHGTLAELEAELAEEDDPERRLAAAEWSLERECELARLQRENEELRRLLSGVLASDAPTASADPAAAPSLPRVPLPPAAAPKPATEEATRQSEGAAQAEETKTEGVSETKAGEGEEGKVDGPEEEEQFTVQGWVSPADLASRGTAGEPSEAAPP